MKISKEAKEQLITEISSEVFAQLEKKKIRLDQSDIENIVSRVQSSIQTPKLDSSEIVKQLLDQVKSTDEEKRVDFYRDQVFTPDIKSAISKQVLDQIEIPKEGEKGEPGKPGKPGKDAQPIPLTDRDKKEIANLIDVTKLIKDRKKDLIILVEQLKTGKIKLPSHAGVDVKEIMAEITKILDHPNWKDRGLSISNDGEVIAIRPDENYSTDDNIDVSSTDNEEEDRIDTVVSISNNPNFDSIKFNDTTKAYLKGQSHFDPSQVTHIFDTAIDGVRLNAGQEEYYLVFNNTESIIANGKACYASGIDIVNNMFTVGVADNTSFSTSAQVLGLATHNIGIDEIGLVTWRGRVNDFNTTVTGFGLSYLGVNGDITNIKPLYPASRVAIGALIKSHESAGIFHVAVSLLPRRSASRSYGFTSADAAAGRHWKAGFYDWADASVLLNQGSLSVNHGDAGISRAAHVGVVPSGPGIVDTGQVGLRVTGTLDSEEEGQVAAQTAIITEDITTLTLDVMAETLEKFSGTVVISLYVVSGTPTAYSLTFNYGYSKYEDFRNIDGTVTAFSAVWEGGQADTVFDISLKYHNELGWTYAATGFEPGNGDICNRLSDQGIDSGVALGIDGAYKRTNLNQFVNGVEKEGVIIEIITGGTKSIRSMDLHISAFSEELF